MEIFNKNCHNCAALNRYINHCTNHLSENYNKKVTDNNQCRAFRPKSICLSCPSYSYVQKICRNRKSRFYSHNVDYEYIKVCQYRYQGYIVSAISDILQLDKKQSYNIMLEALKNGLIDLNAENKTYIDLYEECGYKLAQNLNSDECKEKYALYLKKSYLNDILLSIKERDFLLSLEYYASMIEDMDMHYHTLDDEEKIILNRIIKY